MWAAVTDPQPTGAAFDIVLILHVACVVVGGGTAVVAAIQAARLARVATPDLLPQGLRTYYTPGTNWAARTLFGVPVFGFILLAMSHGDDRLAQGWVLGGLALWLVAAGLAESFLWPAERRLARDLEGWTAPARPGPGAAAHAGDNLPWRARCMPILWAAIGVVATLLVATALMVVRP
jgi:hypothetical protein